MISFDNLKTMYEASKKEAETAKEIMDSAEKKDRLAAEHKQELEALVKKSENRFKRAGQEYDYFIENNEALLKIFGEHKTSGETVPKPLTMLEVIIGNHHRFGTSLKQRTVNGKRFIDHLSLGKESFPKRALKTFGKNPNWRRA